MSYFVGPISVEQGTDVTVGPYTFYPGGTLMNFTGYTGVMDIASAPNSSATVYLSLSTGSGITLGGTTGTITISLTRTQTASLPKGGAYYNLYLTSPGGIKNIWMKGDFIVLAGV